MISQSKLNEVNANDITLNLHILFIASPQYNLFSIFSCDKSLSIHS